MYIFHEILVEMISIQVYQFIEMLGVWHIRLVPHPNTAPYVTEPYFCICNVCSHSRSTAAICCPLNTAGLSLLLQRSSFMPLYFHASLQ
jgi:hypothetical protein